MLHSVKGYCSKTIQNVQSYNLIYIQHKMTQEEQDFDKIFNNITRINKQTFKARYTIEKKLGSGVFGTTSLAIDKLNNRFQELKNHFCF